MPPEGVSICKMCILSNEKWYEYVHVLVRFLSISCFSSSKSLFLYSTVGNKLVFRSQRRCPNVCQQAKRREPCPLVGKYQGRLRVRFYQWMWT
jgi:hypothetical protein